MASGGARPVRGRAVIWFAAKGLSCARNRLRAKLKVMNCERVFTIFIYGGSFGSSYTGHWRRRLAGEGHGSDSCVISCAEFAHPPESPFFHSPRALARAHKGSAALIERPHCVACLAWRPNCLVQTVDFGAGKIPPSANIYPLGAGASCAQVNEVRDQSTSLRR